MDISLALGGGGIKGVAHLGVLEGLEKAGFRVCAIAGTSVGGLVGAVYAAGYKPREILEFLESMNASRMYSRQPTDGPSLLGYTGLAEVLAEMLGETEFSDLKLPFACTAVDLRTSQEIYINEGRVLDAILATIAIPGIFPPKVIGDTELVDGGTLDPVPVNLARSLAPNLPVVAVVLNPPKEAFNLTPAYNFAPSVRLPIPPPLIEGLSRMRIAQAFRIFLQSLDISSRMLTEMRLEVDRPEVIIRPNVHQYGMLDVAIPKELVDEGLRAVEQALPQIQETLSWQNGLLRWLKQIPVSFQPSPASGIRRLPRPAEKLTPAETHSGPAGVKQPAAAKQPAAVKQPNTLNPPAPDNLTASKHATAQEEANK